jgi:hypothetical protein
MTDKAYHGGLFSLYVNKYVGRKTTPRNNSAITEVPDLV